MRIHPKSPMTLLFRIVIAVVLTATAAAAELRKLPPQARLTISVSEWSAIFPVRSKLTGQPMSPGIEIYSDGATIIKRRDGTQLARRIDIKAVQELLAFFQQQGLFKLSTEIVDKEITIPKPIPAPTDNPTTTLFASTDAQKISISRNALGFFVGRFPESQGLQTINRCIAKLYEITGETH